MNQSQSISVYNDFYAVADLSKYAGEWVAILNQTVVAHDKNLKELLENFKKKSPESMPFIAKIPVKEILIW